MEDSGCSCDPGNLYTEGPECRILIPCCGYRTGDEMSGKLQISPKLRETLLVLAGILALAGAVLAVIDLFHATRKAEELYSAGMAGLSIEADLQDYRQESRRVFVKVLTTKDPNGKLAYMDAARTADREVTRLYGAFSGIQLNEATRKQVDQLVLDWNAYVVVRNEMLGLILEDRPDMALELEQSRGAPYFERYARQMQTLKRLLDVYAKQQLMEVRRTFYRCAAEVCFLIFTTALLFACVGLLRRLRNRNEKLTESELLERQRSEILESISANLPLETVFTAIVHLVEQRLTSARSVITTVRDGRLFISCPTTVPPGLINAIDGQPVAALNTASAQAATRGETVFCTAISGAEGIQSCWSVPIRGSHRRILGTLDVFFAQHPPRRTDDLRFVERAAQLGALAMEHRLVNDQLAFQAQHDGLTGLANRVMFHGGLDRSITRAGSEDKGLAVLWIDLDKFKQVNDGLGHQIGDLLLQQVARRLQDSVSSSATVARIGGDEFVILLEDCEEAECAIEVAKGILTKLNEPVLVSPHKISVGASIGIALFPQHGEDRDTLLRNADTAMYSVKFQGKNMYQVYDPKMGAISAETLEIDRLLRSALPEDEFELHYQPQVTSDGQIESVEALLRWTSPTLGRIAPSRFIPLAEENGMIVPLGEWVLREACRQTAVWHRHGFPSLRVAVNVSAHQFVRPDFADTVALALRDSRLQPQFLELELTETAVVRKPEINISQFQKLGRLGVRISIDDFGTGNFSLKYLLQLPADALKIDRSFIDALGRTGRDSLLLVRAIIGMAHAWQLQVVAEGIETQAQLSILRSEGCDLSQGYFLYKPMSAAALSELLSAQVAGASQTIELATRDLLAIVGTESPAHKGMGYETCNSFSTALEK